MPSATSAPLCAAASMPYAPPLIIDQLRSTKPAAKSWAMRTPYWVGFLDPTIANELPVSEGCHRLIGERAAEIVTSVADAVEFLSPM